MISSVSSGCKIHVKEGKWRGINWQISRIIRMAEGGNVHSSVELCSWKTVQAYSFQELCPRFLRTLCKCVSAFGLFVSWLYCVGYAFGIAITPCDEASLAVWHLLIQLGEPGWLKGLWSSREDIWFFGERRRESWCYSRENQWMLAQSCQLLVFPFLAIQIRHCWWEQADCGDTAGVSFSAMKCHYLFHYLNFTITACLLFHRYG